MQFVFAVVFASFVFPSASLAAPTNIWHYQGVVHVRHCISSQLAFQPFGINRVVVENVGQGFEGWQLFEIGNMRMYATETSLGTFFMSFTDSGILTLVRGEPPIGSQVDFSDSRLFERENVPLSLYQNEVLLHVSTNRYVRVRKSRPILTTNIEQATPLCH